MSTAIETDVSIEAQIENRIQNDLNAFGDQLPERYAIAWHAYLAALSEWSVIDFPAYGKLLRLLPKIAEPDPVDTIISGRD